MNLSIVGIGEATPAFSFGRSSRDLAMLAIDAALADAGMQPSEIDAIVIEGEGMNGVVRPAQIADQLNPHDRVLTTQVSVGGAGNVGAAVTASALIEAGVATNVLCYFVGMYGSDRESSAEIHLSDPIKTPLEAPFGLVGQPSYFAMTASRYLHEFGVTEDDLGHVPIAARQWARLHPDALRRDPLTMADYLESPIVASPLRRADCCLLTDSAGAYIMTSRERAVDRSSVPVHILACAIGRSDSSSTSFFTQEARPHELIAAERSAQRAFAAAGITPADIDVAEIYDCFTITCLIQLEAMGFCGRGEAPAFFAEGHTAPGGGLPVNTHGGLLAHSYSVGMGHVIEAVRQLRKEAGDRQVDAELAAVGGFSAWDHATLVLGR